jgi:hypothetical protein
MCLRLLRRAASFINSFLAKPLLDSSLSITNRVPIPPSGIFKVNGLVFDVNIFIDSPRQPNGVFAYVNPVRLVQSYRRKANVLAGFRALRFINGCRYFSLLFAESYL